MYLSTIKELSLPLAKHLNLNTGIGMLYSPILIKEKPATKRKIVLPFPLSFKRPFAEP